MAGACIVGSAWLLAGGIERMLRTPTVARLDLAASELALHHTGPGMVQAMRWVSGLHGTAAILMLGGLAAAWLWRRGSHPLLPHLLAAVPGGLLLNALVKLAVHRARPEGGAAAEQLESFSFPSGHVAGATVFYGFLVCWWWSRGGSMPGQILVALLALATVALVAASRILLGVHFLSDCIAALGEGLLWVAICLRGAPLRAARVP
jgi:membrane-associated phospholipid phosphatase